MRVLVAALATATAVILGLLALAAFNLHVFIDAHRDELVTRGERTLGRTVQIGDVTPSWWPIGIRFADVVIGEDPRFGAGPCVHAAAVRIAVRPGPLLLGRLEVSASVLDRPPITLVRDAADTPFSLQLDLHDADLGTLATVAGRRERWSGRLAQVVADATGVLDRFAVDVDASADDAWRLGPQVAVPRLPSHLSLRAQATRDAIRVERASGAFGTLEWTAAGLVELRPWHVELTLQSVPESALAIG